MDNAFTFDVKPCIMKTIKRTILTVAVLLCYSTVFAQNFKIEGTTEGLADGTWLYLRTASPETLLDSAKVMSNKFSFKGKRTEKATHVAIYTAKYTNYVFFWLENKSMTVALKNGEFKKGIIKGSATQDEYNKLGQLRNYIDFREDSLTNLLNKATTEETKKDLKKKLANLRKEDQQIDIDYVKNNPNSLIATYLLNVYTSTWGKEKVNELYQKLSPEMKQNRFGKEIAEFIKLNQSIKIGERFADFEQLNTKGKRVKLSEIKGKYILLEFWASWCGPCREENPKLVETYNAFKDKGFAILSVSADDNKKYWLEAVEKDGLAWENVSDLNGDKNKASLIYGINAYPTNFLIDDKGIIIAKNLRGDNLRKKLEELLP